MKLKWGLSRTKNQHAASCSRISYRHKTFAYYLRVLGDKHKLNHWSTNQYELSLSQTLSNNNLSNSDGHNFLPLLQTKHKVNEYFYLQTKLKSEQHVHICASSTWFSWKCGNTNFGKHEYNFVALFENWKVFDKGIFLSPSVHSQWGPQSYVACLQWV